MTSTSSGNYHETSRTWTHIKVLYILNIVLAAVVLALFVVCFMMLLDVQRSHNNEVKLRKDRENQILNSIVENNTGKASSQRAEISTSIDENPESMIVVGDGSLKINAATLTRFCASLHSHCPLRGPTGLQGIPGDSIRGARGPRGLPGIDGVSGVKGEKGEFGAPGFGLMGMTGAPGKPGPKGTKGSQGGVGAVGPKGTPGEPGKTGLSVKGEPGNKGQKGKTGLPGHDGVDGLTGLKGDKGQPGLPGLKGAKGDPGIVNNFTSEQVVVKGEKGEPGLPGLSGKTGMTGLSGSPGLPGPSGSPGEKGSKGDNGIIGPPGLPGEPGDMGLQGPIGLPGVNGIPGSDGLPGATGLSGLIGQKGEKGDAPILTADTLLKYNITQFLKGPIGAKGEPGVVGPPGDTGRRGKRGLKGEPGDAIQCECLIGPPGEKGDPGVCQRSPPTFLLYQNTTIPERKEDLTIKTIGKPVLLRTTDSDWGSWMVDSDPTPTTKDKYYLTYHFTGRSIYEFASKDQFSSKTGNYSKVYNIQDQFYGTGGAIYRGAFYYQSAGLDAIARYDLDSRLKTTQLKIASSLHRGSETLFGTSYNYYDLAVDENGLWALYAYKPDIIEPALPNTLMVSKLEPNYVEIEKTWNVTVSRADYSNAFIAQGILYLLESGTELNSQISFAYDLYSNSEVDLSLPFTNAFRNNRMLSYRPDNKAIMAWDGKNIVVQPILSE